MKYILSIIISFMCLSAYATLPSTIMVYSSQLAGGKINVCRALFALYSVEYKADTIFIIKPGADGVIAMEEMLKSKDFALLCSGPSESIYNNAQYPGHEASHAELTAVLVVSDSPFSFITGVNNKYSTLPELLKSGKPIMVGYHTQGNKFIAQSVFGDYPVTWVSYKNAIDGIPSLMDGSLDVYTDGGALEVIAKSGKLKSLGHFNGLADTSGINLNKVYPSVAKFSVFTSITISSKYSSADIEELNKRFNRILRSPEMLEALKTNINVPHGGTIKETNDFIDNFRKSVSGR